MKSLAHALQNSIKELARTNAHAQLANEKSLSWMYDSAYAIYQFGFSNLSAKVQNLPKHNRFLLVYITEKFTSKTIIGMASSGVLMF